MDNEFVLEERRDQVVLLTLNRPEVMNSFNFAMLRALKERMEVLHFDSQARVVVVTGAGDRAFCAGADLKERATYSEDQVREFIFTIRNLFTFIEAMNKFHGSPRWRASVRQSRWMQEVHGHGGIYALLSSGDAL